MYDINLLFLQHLLNGFDRKKVQNIGVHCSFADIFDHIIRVRRRCIWNNRVSDSSLFQLGYKSAFGICDDKRLIFVKIKRVQKIQKRICGSGELGQVGNITDFHVHLL